VKINSLFGTKCNHVIKHLNYKCLIYACDRILLERLDGLDMQRRDSRCRIYTAGVTLCVGTLRLGIYVEQSGTVADFPPSSPVFPCYCHTITLPHSYECFIHLPSTSCKLATDGVVNETIKILNTKTHYTLKH
jgi:hypothetical protein